MLILFLLPFYVVVAIAFGTVDPVFQSPLPVFQPWFWSAKYVAQEWHLVIGEFRAVEIRTLTYVLLASGICLVIAYAVAYYVARYGGTPDQSNRPCPARVDDRPRAQLLDQAAQGDLLPGAGGGHLDHHPADPGPEAIALGDLGHRPHHLLAGRRLGAVVHRGRARLRFHAHAAPLRNQPAHLGVEPGEGKSLVGVGLAEAVVAEQEHAGHRDQVAKGGRRPAADHDDPQDAGNQALESVDIFREGTCRGGPWDDFSQGPVEVAGEQESVGRDTAKAAFD